MQIFISVFWKFTVSWVQPKHATTHFKINPFVLHFLMYDFSQGLHFPTIKMHAPLPFSVLVIINSAEYKLLLRYVHVAKAAKPKHRKV